MPLRTMTNMELRALKLLVSEVVLVRFARRACRQKRELDQLVEYEVKRAQIQAKAEAKLEKQEERAQAQREAREQKEAAWRAALRDQELKRLAAEKEEEAVNKAADQARPHQNLPRAADPALHARRSIQLLHEIVMAGLARRVGGLDKSEMPNVLRG
jgi:phage/plasmid primase-like uncharacterized protein